MDYRGAASRAVDPHKGPERQLLFFQSRMDCLEMHIHATLNLLRGHFSDRSSNSGDEFLLSNFGARMQEKTKFWTANPARCLIDAKSVQDWIDSRDLDVWAIYMRCSSGSNITHQSRQWTNDRSTAHRLDQSYYNHDVCLLLERISSIERSNFFATALCQLSAKDLEDLLSIIRKERHRVKHLAALKLSQAQRAARLDIIDYLVGAIQTRRPEINTALLCLDENEIQHITQTSVNTGGFSNVYRGSWHGEHVALKILKFSFDGNDKFKRRFDKESRLWSGLSHPSVLEFYGVYRQVPRDAAMSDYGHARHDHFHMVSPWMTNGSAMEYCARKPDVDRLALLIQVAEGLVYLRHLDPAVVHGDLKGDNILITEQGTAVLSDFGLAAIPGQHQVSSSINLGGSVRWMAPELLHCLENEGPSVGVTHESDVYAFGMTALQFLTGMVPYRELPRRGTDVNVARFILAGRKPDRPQDCVAITDDIWRLLEHCWNKRPEERPTIDMVLNALLEIQESVQAKRHADALAARQARQAEQVQKVKKATSLKPPSSTKKATPIVPLSTTPSRGRQDLKPRTSISSIATSTSRSSSPWPRLSLKIMVPSKKKKVQTPAEMQTIPTASEEALQKTPVAVPRTIQPPRKVASVDNGGVYPDDRTPTASSFFAMSRVGTSALELEVLSIPAQIEEAISTPLSLTRPTVSPPLTPRLPLGSAWNRQPRIPGLATPVSTPSITPPTPAVSFAGSGTAVDTLSHPPSVVSAEATPRATNAPSMHPSPARASIKLSPRSRANSSSSLASDSSAYSSTTLLATDAEHERPTQRTKGKRSSSSESTRIGSSPESPHGKGSGTDSKKSQPIQGTSTTTALPRWEGVETKVTYAQKARTPAANLRKNPAAVKEVGKDIPPQHAYPPMPRPALRFAADKPTATPSVLKSAARKVAAATPPIVTPTFQRSKIAPRTFTPPPWH